MALSRNNGRRSDANIWPGFVDAMTALLLVLTFVLSIFMIVQFVLRETISGQGEELDALGLQIAGLSSALGLEESKNTNLEDRVSTLQGLLGEAQNDIEGLQGQVASFESQVAGLLADKSSLETQRGALETDLAALNAEQARTLTEKEAVQLALAKARSEIDDKVEAARLDAAKREALNALIASLEADVVAKDQEIIEKQTALLNSEKDITERELALSKLNKQLSDAEKLRIAEAAAAALLQDRLKNSQTELTAMTLALEAKRKEAEDRLTLLAAAELAKKQLQNQQTVTLTDAQKKEALLAQANKLLSQEKALGADAQRKLALLNQQTVELRTQLNQLQGLLDDAAQKDTESQIQMQALGNNLNTALARVAAEQKKRAELEQAERERLEAETKNLEQFRSEFFGRIRALLEGQEGVRMVGDRFVFSSEVLFAPGSANLGVGGKNELRKVAGILKGIADEIPPQIDWILRVDGHTDRVPIRASIQFKDNWELSQARALSVVKYLIQPLGIPANRLAANGFGEFQPLDTGDSQAAYATNRRIELKFTEK